MTSYKPIPDLSPLQQCSFWERVDIDMYDTDACFPWKGLKSIKGYGTVCFGYRNYQAHRVAYTLVRGPIPDGLTIDHLCRNRLCCNPAHLEAVTMAENVARGEAPTALNARKTHCPKGHPYDDERRGRRVCKTCRRNEWDQENRYKFLRERGLCVRCKKPSETYRCDRCRQLHNATNRPRKR